MVSGSADFDAWYPRYNEYISDWLNEQVTSVSSALEELESSLKESTDEEAKKKIEDQIIEKKKELNRFTSRQNLGIAGKSQLGKWARTTRDWGSLIKERWGI